MARTYWMLVSSADNFERMRARGFDLAGMKPRHRKKAERVRPGDKIVFYCTKVKAFAGTAEVTGTYFEDDAVIFCGDAPGAPAYPFRFPIAPEVVCAPNAYVPAADLRERLVYPQKWPPKHWTLAFQGNAHVIPPQDYRTVKRAVAKKATVAA